MALERSSTKQGSKSCKLGAQCIFFLFFSYLFFNSGFLKAEILLLTLPLGFCALLCVIYLDNRSSEMCLN